MQDAILADRIQFAFTIMFHYLFPIGTMGLAPFIAWYTVKGVRNGDEGAMHEDPPAPSGAPKPRSTV